MVTIRNKISRAIVEKLRLRKERIISKKEIFALTKAYQNIYKQKVNWNSLWTYLRESNYIKRILGDYYYIYSLEERHNRYCHYSEEELVFLVLSKMDIKWYLGLERALQEHKLGWQALTITPIINTYYSGIKKLGSSRFKFIKTSEKRCRFGLVERKTNNQVAYFYSNLEKTYLDFLYFYSYQGKDLKTIRRQLDFQIKMKVARKYARHYSKKIQRVLFPEVL